MATITSPSDTIRRLTRTVAAPREKVFQAWTTPEALKRWFAPSDDQRSPCCSHSSENGRSRYEDHLTPV